MSLDFPHGLLTKAGLCWLVILSSSCIFGDVKRLKTDVAELQGQVNSLQVSTKERLGETQRNFQNRQVVLSQRLNEVESKLDSLRGEIARTSYELNALQSRLAHFGQAFMSTSQSMRDSLAVNIAALEMALSERQRRSDSLFYFRLEEQNKKILQLNRRLSREVAALKALWEKSVNEILDVLAAGEGKGGAGGSKTHLVKPGDTLYNIAKKYGVTIAALKKANGMTGKNPVITPGMRLIIPGK